MAWLIACLSYTSLFITARQLSVKGFPDDSVVRNLPIDAGDRGSTPGSGRSPGGRNGNPLQYSCLKNPVDRGAWRAAAHGVAKSWAQFRSMLSTLLS